MIRSFIAIELSEALRGAVAELQQRLKGEVGRELRRRSPGARIQWVRPEAVHVTLKFLGDVPESSLDEIRGAMAAAARSRAPVSLEVGGLGLFPEQGAPRVVWLGLSGAVPQLVDLAGALDAELAELGYPRERRPFQPHLTLGRIKAGGPDVGRVLREQGWLGASEPIGTLDVSALALMKSELHPTGSIYTRLAAVGIGANSE